MRILNFFRPRSLMALLAMVGAMLVARAAASPQEGRFLYVATPGIRDYLEYGGHGILVYDIDHGHRLVRRITSAGDGEKREPTNIEGSWARGAKGGRHGGRMGTVMWLDVARDKRLGGKKY